MSEARKGMADALADLKTYANRSVDGLGRMRDSMQEAMDATRSPLDAYAEDAKSFMPMFGLSEGMRMGREAGRLWGKGQYADSLDRYADAIDAPMADALWFAPGAGLIRKLK